MPAPHPPRPAAGPPHFRSLREKSRDALLLALTRAANVADAAVSIHSDETQLAYLVEVRRT
jgi:hypothetical protein